jgi:hypothetical protein
MTGKRFGKWMVLEKAGSNKHGSMLYLCRCDCGAERRVVGSNLRNGKSKGCGCGRIGLKGERNGHWNGGRYINHSGYVMIYNPGHKRAMQNGYVREHILLAEKALGHELPEGVQIHHMGDSEDNSKIIICQDQQYHFLIHSREKAMLACGNPAWRKCKFCQKYDNPKNLHITQIKSNGVLDGWNIHHQSCETTYEWNRKHGAKRVPDTSD